MDSNIIVAIIGAAATIVAALIAFLAVMISREKKKKSTSDRPEKSSGTAVNKQKAKANRGSTVIQIGGAKSE